MRKTEIQRTESKRVVTSYFYSTAVDVSERQQQQNMKERIANNISRQQEEKFKSRKKIKNFVRKRRIFVT